MDDLGIVSREGAGNAVGRSAAVATSPVLPVYIAVDESASMAPHVHDLNKGIEALYEALWTNPVLADYVRLAATALRDRQFPRRAINSARPLGAMCSPVARPQRFPYFAIS